MSFGFRSERHREEALKAIRFSAITLASVKKFIVQGQCRNAQYEYALARDVRGAAVAHIRSMATTVGVGPVVSRLERLDRAFLRTASRIHQKCVVERGREGEL